MTKYVLNGGAVKKDKEKAKKFFAEVFAGLGERPRLLICCFAQKREDWDEYYKKDQEIFPAFFPEGMNPEMSLAYPATFEKQIAESDVVYLHGGDDHLLQYWLRKFDIPKIWQGKVVATSSASSDAMAKHFFTCDWRECMDGLGILPIKFIPHYESDFGSTDERGPVDWQKAYEDLKNFGDKTLPIYALKEGEYVVMESE